MKDETVSHTSSHHLPTHLAPSAPQAPTPTEPEVSNTKDIQAGTDHSATSYLPVP